MSRHRIRFAMRVWTLRRLPPEHAGRRLLECALAAGATLVGVAVIVLIYRRILFSALAYTVFTQSSSQVVGGVGRVISFQQRVIPAPGSHPPAVWPFVGPALLLGLLPLGAVLHALWFRRCGLVLLVAEMALLALGLGAALVAGRFLPLPLLVSAAEMMLPALVLALAAVILGIVVELGDDASIPVD